uniref:Uncharacterized protein n=1 Tax=Romanomermis culicivorax TaxID=13658 RepID=A0A915I5I4_ROMCU
MNGRRLLVEKKLVQSEISIPEINLDYHGLKEEYDQTLLVQVSWKNKEQDWVEMWSDGAQNFKKWCVQMDDAL